MLAKLTTRLVPELEIDKRLLRLRSMPMPAAAVEETENVTFACDVPKAARLTCGQPLLGGQPCRVLAVSLKKVSTGFEKETMTPVYWPAGMFPNVPRKRVSDCNRMRSTTGEPLSERACCVPPEVTSAIPVMVTLKVTKEGLAGRVSATMVRLTVPVPPQLEMHMVPVLGPLQAASDKAASRRTGRSDRALLRFMWHPMTA